MKPHPEGELPRERQERADELLEKMARGQRLTAPEAEFLARLPGGPELPDNDV